MSEEMKHQNQTLSQKLHRSEVEFDRWAQAVRQQMVAALKRRGNA
jgi:hypothetical protein